jgi:hypothetical protein
VERVPISFFTEQTSNYGINLSNEEEIVIPQMVGFATLSKIIIAYLKVGGDEQEKSYSEVAAMAKVNENNVSLNTKFLCSVGIIEGSAGRFKLTSMGKQYAKSLDWGKLDEANRLLRETLKDKPITKKILGYLDIHQPVSKEDLVSQIALFADVTKEPRFETGIRGFLDMLMTCGLVEEDANGKLISSRERTAEGELPQTPLKEDKEWLKTMQPPIQEEKRITFPITLNLNIDNNTDLERLKTILETIKKVFEKP